MIKPAFLTVRFLESRTRRSSSILLWFTSAWVTDEKVAIILDQCLSQFILGVFIDILGVVGDNTLGNGRSNGINLSGNTSSLDSNTNIEGAELVLSDNEDWFKYL